MTRALLSTAVQMARGDGGRQQVVVAGGGEGCRLERLPAVRGATLRLESRAVSSQEQVSYSAPRTPVP